ncbi:SDR family NAD(P)-dependent oxidoreductase, partial [Bacillus vallismortis]|nr:SDR family NAD(P)-dependent oxidoreductase [Bacillus vallismortis]
ITDVDNATVQEMVQLQVPSPDMLTRTLLPGMIRTRSGAIDAVSSIWGETGASSEVLYSMAKGSQHSFVNGLAQELA